MAIVNLHPERVPYKALGNKVLVRVVKRKVLRGVDLPDTAVEAQRYFAMSVGPKVEGIHIGDEIILGGMQVPFLEVPGEQDLIVVLDAHCFLVKSGGE